MRESKQTTLADFWALKQTPNKPIKNVKKAAKAKPKRKEILNVAKQGKKNKLVKKKLCGNTTFLEECELEYKAADCFIKTADVTPEKPAVSTNV